MNNLQTESGFQITPWVHAVGASVERHNRFWIRLGNLETRLLEDDLAQISSPVYISGLARAGSTLLLEILSWHPEVATHRYRDYPLLFTPYFWDRFLARVPQQEESPQERSHHDGIMVTSESPEAFDEILWMAFFPDLHDPLKNAVLDGEIFYTEFNRFYRDHIRKLLKVRGSTRYVSKANYNVTRLEYLLELFPDARFVIPVREPVWHIASLMKQHALFCKAAEQDRRTLVHLRRVGHFEFGLDRRPINAGDRATVRRIVELWDAGREVEGWALYWRHIYSFLADRLQANEHLREATLVLPFEELCTSPLHTICRLFEHCRLSLSKNMLDRAVQRIHFPSYYRPEFTAQELRTIKRYTEDVAARYGLGRYELQKADNP